ncbi:hypothetical protein COS59_01040 [Candidatus Wolfebacteria bacterium CG03_land_8_20_14_0_80_36_15]|uniref:FCP1 homology domain-containing protein n=1 Tax=Candidatus Wolfebacteria bacterium CG03_land_8_20_14_0_80_36_15 TaxID=1975067 RepID=A0A2M7B7V8_9BACT|nr:MAG: hypothetical protein COS59_01040 [Candidatus Wolfebacteria bacterium CG03_land_8_20_14_0_80_36_15]
MTIGFDLDGVISLLPFGFKQIYQKAKGEEVFWRLQSSKWLQKFYNFFFRKPNEEIWRLMKLYKENGHRVIAISAASETSCEETVKWLKHHRFCLDLLHLRTSLLESVVAFKRRILKKENCDLYLEDKEKIVKELNLLINPCKILLYRPGRISELFKILTR